MESPATSGFTGVTPISNPDAVRPMEDNQMGGGLEDDPLEGLNKPKGSLQDRLGSNNDDDDDSSGSNSSSGNTDDDSDT